MNALLSGGGVSDPIRMQKHLEVFWRGHAGCSRCGPNTDDVVRSKTYPEFFFRPAYRHPDTVETMPGGPPGNVCPESPKYDRSSRVNL